MAAILGALLGAATIILIGRSAKGRDFIGLAVAMLFLSLAASLVFMPAFHQAERIAAAGGGGAAHLDIASYIVAGIGAYVIAVVPGLMFVGLAKGADN